MPQNLTKMDNLQEQIVRKPNEVDFASLIKQVNQAKEAHQEVIDGKNYLIIQSKMNY